MHVTAVVGGCSLRSCACKPRERLEASFACATCRHAADQGRDAHARPRDDQEPVYEWQTAGAATLRGSSIGEGAAAAFFFRPALYVSSRKHILKANILRISYERCLAHAQRRRGALSPVEFMRSCSSCSGWPSQASWQAFRLSLERRPHPCSRCRARAAAAVALCVSALISGVATVITCIARHKALSRLAGAAVKQMAAHDGRDVHLSAHSAAQTPIDSGVCESFERSAW